MFTVGVFLAGATTSSGQIAEFRWQIALFEGSNFKIVHKPLQIT